MLSKWTTSLKIWNFSHEHQESYLYNDCWIHLSKPKVRHHSPNRSFPIQDTYCAQYLFLLQTHVSSGSWMTQSCADHGAGIEGKGSTVRLPGTTGSKRSRSCRQGLKTLRKVDTKRNILPKILGVHLWCNSFRVFFISANFIQKEPNRLQSCQMVSRESASCCHMHYNTQLRT